MGLLQGCECEEGWHFLARPSGLWNHVGFRVQGEGHVGLKLSRMCESIGALCSLLWHPSSAKGHGCLAGSCCKKLQTFKRMSLFLADSADGLHLT